MASTTHGLQQPATGWLTERAYSHAVSGLLVVFVAACTLMHIVQPERSPVDMAVSYYMNGESGWIMGAGIVALGAASLLLLARIRTTIRGSMSRTGLICLFIWGISCVVAGLAAPDPFGQWNRPPSNSGLTHGVAAMFAFTGFPLAALLLSATWPASHHRGSLKSIAILGAVATLIFFACLLPAFRNRPPYALGLAERVVLALHIVWLFLANRNAVTHTKNIS